MIQYFHKKEVLIVLKEVELSSIEATAYWWVNTIRFRLRDIMTSGASDNNETLFAEIFYNFTEIDWRRLYLELVKSILVKV